MALNRIMNLGPVKRYRSERYVLISLVTFALTVLALRGILKLTGYVQIGNESLHIAHVLWGGLALFAAALLLLVVSNRWALVLGAVLSGGGVGLFIDEVGKFVTQSNDYFTPAAAPIIYALFLATVLVYLRVRRPPARDARGEMYRALEQMSGVLDHEMSRHDLNELAHRLAQVQDSAKDEAARRLAASMLAFVEAERPRIVEPQPGRTQRLFSCVRAWARRVFTRPRLRAFLVFALVVGGVYAVLDMALLAFLAVSPASAATEFLRDLVSPGELAALGDKIWFSVRAVLEGGVGVATLAGGVLIGLRREGRGLSIAVAGLIIDLTVVNLLVFYQDQFKALIGTALQYVVLVAAFSYRRIYLEEEGESASWAEEATRAESAGTLREVSADSAAIASGSS
ncbi:MAG: hypothetical protein V1912_05275 [bacterium]